MIDAAVILLRLAQYGAASILLGSSLFFLYAIPASKGLSATNLHWPRHLSAIAAAALIVSTLLGLVAQTAVMAGSLAEALKLPSLQAVVSGMNLGKAAVVRALVAGTALVLLLLPIPARSRWVLTAFLGAVANASFAWMGHGAATEGVGGWIHLSSDILHSWAAAGWIGALCGFVLLLTRREHSMFAKRSCYSALHRFSGFGTLFVISLIVTGLINSWFVVGPENAATLLKTEYGLLLSLKLVLFAGMVVLASANRFRLVPRFKAELDELGADAPSLSDLRLSVLLETLLAFGVLATVAWFGMLSPPAA